MSQSTDKPSDQNRRSFQRVGVEAAVEIGPCSGSIVRSTTRNVCLVGLLLQDDLGLEPGTECSIRLALGDHRLDSLGEQVVLEGRVVRNGSDGTAIAVDEMEISSVLKLADLIGGDRGSTKQRASSELRDLSTELDASLAAAVLGAKRSVN